MTETHRFTLREEMSYQFEVLIDDRDRAFKYADVEVVKVYWPLIDKTHKPWPGRHRNVGVYYELANGMLVGEADNDSAGLSWPVMKKPKDWKGEV